MITPNPDAPHNEAMMSVVPTGGADQRRHPRIPRRVTVDFLNMGDDPRIPFYQDFVPGETEDVSNGGMRVRANYDIPEGAELGIIVRNQDRFKVFLARVIWKMRIEESCVYGLSAPRVEPDHLP